MKNRIVINTNNRNGINFYLEMPHKKIYLFTETFSKSVYKFFYNSRLESEVRGFKRWKNGGYRLCKTITKLPMYIDYAIKEDKAYNTAA